MILIGCPTYSGKDYCLVEFLEGIKQFKGVDILFVDNTKGKDYYKKLKGLGLNVIHDECDGSDYERIIHSRNVIRDYFLNGKYDYLLSMDVDVVAPKNAIEPLRKMDVDIASGVYINSMDYDGESIVVPLIFTLEDDESVKTIQPPEVIKSQIIEIGLCGLGCVLIKRKVLEEVKFELISKISGDDVGFCYSALKKGFKIFANTAVKCKHYDKKGYLFIDERGFVYKKR